MTSNPPSNMAASVHDRLLIIARSTGRPFGELLQYYAMERFLYRLSRSVHAEKFVLKGALMLRVWSAPASRPTLDIDLEGYTDNSPENLTGVMREVCIQKVEEDGLQFLPETVGAQRITEDADYSGVRLRFQALLGNARVTMQIDVGFGDPVTPEAEMIELPTILEFPPPRLRGYSMESTVAEKFEAMVRLGRLNSRMKDFYDIWYLCRAFEFDGAIFAQALKNTFDNRGVEIEMDPEALTQDFAADSVLNGRWRAFRRKSALVDTPESLEEIIAVLRAFLGPVCAAIAGGQAFASKWLYPGPWSA